MSSQIDLDEIISQCIRHCMISRELYPMVGGMVNDALLQKGKRMRPRLAFETYLIFNPLGRVDEVSCYLTALELFHTFTLVHDDVMDGASMRRGVPSINAKYGNNLAILVGDILQSMSYYELSRGENKRHNEVSELFREMSLNLCEGQVADLGSDRLGIDRCAYESMAIGKTGSLIIGSLRLGAILGNASMEDEKVMIRVGECIGMALAHYPKVQIAPLRIS